MDSFGDVKQAVHRIETLLRAAEEEIEMHEDELDAARGEVVAYKAFLETHRAE